MNLRPVDFGLLSDAIKFYKFKGYTQIEVPWIVPSEYSFATMSDVLAQNPDAHPITCTDGDLIGSGEQGLLYLAATGQITFKKYVTLTPCFRNEIEDDLHCRQFWKVELISFRSEISTEHRDELLADAENFMSMRMGIKREYLSNNQVDLLNTLNNIEVGSYGIRSAFGCSWAYGTGIAEPRFSTTLSIY